MTDTKGSATGHPRVMPHPGADEIVLPAVLFALSDPARLDLVRALDADGPQTVAQCHTLEPDVPKSTFSHHLRTLREAGVVRNEPHGRQRRVTLRRADLDARFPGLIAAVLGQDAAGSAERGRDGVNTAATTAAAKMSRPVTRKARS